MVLTKKVFLFHFLTTKVIKKWKVKLCVCVCGSQEAYSVARQFNLIPPICEQAEYHMFQREKVEVQLPELFHKIGVCVCACVHLCACVKKRGRAREVETESQGQMSLTMMSICYFAGVGAMTWSPLACGIISGKYDSGVPPSSRASLKVILQPCRILVTVPVPHSLTVF